jgi:hypothetical protein
MILKTDVGEKGDFTIHLLALIGNPIFFVNPASGGSV